MEAFKNQGAKIGISTQIRCRTLYKWIYLLKFLLMRSLTELLYASLLRFVKLALRFAGVFHSKTRLKMKGEKNWKNTVLRDQSKPLIWFHCASLGEFEQGRPVMERFRKQHPDWQILLTFFSPSGYEIRKNYEGADIICYLPFDLPREVNAFLDLYQPRLAVFVKYEFWRNFSFELKRREIPLISISTILRKDQYFFKWWGGFGRNTLKRFDHFFVQNQRTKELLNSIGIVQTTLAGDTRFDRVADTLKSSRQVSEIERFKGDSKLMVCGSVWEEDMEVLMGVFSATLELTEAGDRKQEAGNGEKGEGKSENGDSAESQPLTFNLQPSNFKNLKLVIAPHEINQRQIDGWIDQIEKPCLKFSEITPDTNLENFEVLFIDSIGLLSSLYRYGDFAFIGGAYGKGLHNILEAATFGMPIFFGDQSYYKFQEANDLIGQKVAFPIADEEGLKDKIFYFLQNEQDLSKTSNLASEYVKNHTGATDVVLKWIEQEISTR